MKKITLLLFAWLSVLGSIAQTPLPPGRGAEWQYFTAPPSTKPQGFTLYDTWHDTLNNNYYKYNSTTKQFYLSAALRPIQGTPGKDGTAATVTVGSTLTGAAGSPATVFNSGTISQAVLNFTIPVSSSSTSTSSAAIPANTLHVTNQAELYAAFRTAESVGVNHIYVDCASMPIDSGVREPGQLAARSRSLWIHWQGCNLIPMNDTIKWCLYRMPKDSSEALNKYQSQAIWNEDVNIIGRNNTTTGGILYAAGYQGGVVYSAFNQLANGVEFQFVLQGTIDNCKFNECNHIPIALKNGKYKGASLSGDQTNGTIVSNCRAYNGVGTFAALYDEGGTNNFVLNFISEGYPVKYHFYHDALKSNWSKGITYQNCWTECPADSAIFRLIMQGGTVKISQLFNQMSSVLISAEDSLANAHIILENIPWMTDATQFKCTKGNPVFVFIDVPQDLTNASKWIGPKPFYITQVNLAQFLQVKDGNMQINSKSF